LTDDQVQKLKVGDRIKLGALTGTIVQAGALFAAAGQSASATENLTNLTTSHLLVPSAMGLLLLRALQNQVDVTTADCRWIT
jgi:hypothetical protein